MSTLINRILSNLATRIMFIIYLSIIIVTTFFIVFGYYNKLTLQEQRQYDKLKAIVSSVAINMNGDDHLILMNRFDRNSNHEDIKRDTIYNKISDELNRVVKVNDLNSPIYTLVHDQLSDQFIYGVRSDEYVDFKNPYTQSPLALKEKWETGGTLPMYESENGTWISAFHPIRSADGSVVAVIEADIEFSEFSQIVNEQFFKEMWVSIAVILALALLLTPYARKILIKDQRQKELFLRQKKMIELKNRDITDSIKYALRIQSAVLPPSNILEKNGLDSFILHQPKDIVAGDFYWMERHENYLYVAVADCTGHGVPGAIMSILCLGALNKAVDVNGIRDTAKILDMVRKIILERLAQGQGEKEISDGMDIALCRIDLDTLNVQYSGANNPIYIYSTAIAEIIKGQPCKQPVGKYIHQQPFQSKDYQLSKGDMIYLFTDGFADQFGGPKGKKFKYKAFKELIKSNTQLDMDEQKKKLIEALNEWKGATEQIDDICVVGVRI